MLLLDIPKNKILISDLIILCDQIKDVSILITVNLFYNKFCFLQHISDRVIIRNILKFTSILHKKNMQMQEIVGDHNEDVEVKQ